MAEIPVRHWVSFSNSDQRVLCEETHGWLWDALVVPGTLATYYKQGVGGYVLASRRPFVIDPRTPLLQPSSLRPRPVPRASHETLAAIHDDEVGRIWSQGREVRLETWNPDRWESAVARVLRFQTSFESQAAEKISKYEKILREAGMELDGFPVHGPDRLIPPYWSVLDQHDQWWGLAHKAVEYAIRDHGPQRLMPVLCLGTDAPSPRAFVDLLNELPEGLDRVFCWKGSWDEAHASEEDVTGWLETVDAAAMRGIEVTNMYGGALSVLMTGLGLNGVNHGVGYSESRSERRLGQTGAPPMRYYMPRLRQFLPVPQAQRALENLAEDGDDWRCDCAVCRDRSTIVDLRTEELKLHFLLCRRREFDEARSGIGEAVDALEEDGERLVERFADADDARQILAIRGQILVRWATALSPHLPR
jgi:hypothetical protein